MGAPEIYIAGDSTAACYDAQTTPMVGWGQLLGEYLPGVVIHNHAMAGRSTRTFLEEGRLQRLDGLLKTGDLLLIQFGHNDEGDKPERHTEPWGDFTENLKIFVRFARERGARPVLMTPTCIRTWKEGRLQPSHGEYLLAIRALAEAQQVPFIDFYEETFRIVSEAGEEGSKALFMHILPGEDSRMPEGRADDTHTREPAARPYAARAAECLRKLFPEDFPA